MANYPTKDDQDQRPEDTLYPVLVYIHGEDFSWGAGSLHDGRVLATYGKVIVVTFNFRIGVLGIIFHYLDVASIKLCDAK